MSRKLALGFLLRPNERFAMWLLREYARFWTSAGVEPGVLTRNALIAVHIRWGDKVVENALTPAPIYLEHVLRIAQFRQIEQPVVFLSSEDGTAITLFKRAVQEHPNASRVTVLAYDYKRPSMNCGGFNATEALGKTSALGVKVDTTREYMQRYGKMFNDSQSACASTTALRNIAYSQSESLTKVSMLNLYMALEARHIICHAHSNWCKLMTELKSPLTGFTSA